MNGIFLLKLIILLLLINIIWILQNGEDSFFIKSLIQAFFYNLFHVLWVLRSKSFRVIKSCSKNAKRKKIKPKKLNNIPVLHRLFIFKIAETSHTNSALSTMDYSIIMDHWSPTKILLNLCKWGKLKNSNNQRVLSICLTYVEENLSHKMKNTQNILAITLNIHANYALIWNCFAIMYLCKKFSSVIYRLFMMNPKWKLKSTYNNTDKLLINT